MRDDSCRLGEHLLNRRAWCVSTPTQRTYRRRQASSDRDRSVSTKATTWVWEHSEAEDTDRLVLLAIADAADADGNNAWPALDKIAKFVRKSERTVRRSIRSLEELGELAVEIKAGGTTNCRPDRRPNLYRLPLITEPRRQDTLDPSSSNDGASNQVNEGSQLRPVMHDPSTLHDRTPGASRPDTLSVVTTGHCCPIEQNQNTLIERGGIPAALVDNSAPVSAKFAALRELGGYEAVAQ